MACSDREPSTTWPSKKVIDYIHQPTIQQKFYPADSLKWRQQYLSAANAFEQLLQQTTTYTIEENAYLKNQLIRCYLFTNQWENANRVLTEMKHAAQINDLSPLAKADYYLNQAKYLQLIGEGMEVLPLLQQAEKTYTQYYPSGHLKMIETAVEIGIFNEYYSDHINSFVTEVYYLDLVKTYLQKDSNLQTYAKEYHLLNSIATFAQRKNSEGLVSADIAIRLAENNLEFVDTAFIARCHNIKAIHYKAIANNENGDQKIIAQKKGEENLNLALQLGEAVEDNLYLQEIYKDLGIHYTGLQNVEQFEAILLKIDEKFPSANMVHPIRLRARWFWEKGNFQKAIPLYKTLIQQLDQQAIRYNRYRLYDESYFLINKMYRLQAQLDSSIHYMSKVLFLGKEKYQQEQYTWEDIEHFHLDQNDNQSFIYTGSLAYCYAAKHRANQPNFSSLKKALHLYKQTDQLLFNYSLMANDEASLNFLSELVSADYPNAIKAAYHLFEETQDAAYLEKASFFMERMKSFSLYRDIYTSKHLAQTTPQSKALMQKEEVIRQQLAKLKWKRFLQEQTAKTSHLDQKIQAQLDALEKLYKDFQQDLPLYFSSKMQTDFQPIQTSQQYLKTLEHQQVLLQYALDSENIYALLVQADSVTFVQTPKSIHFDSILLVYQNQVSQYENAIDLDGYQSYLHNAFFLYQQLVQPFIEAIPNDAQLTIIPDAQLQQVPFEALLMELPKSQKEINYQHLTYWIKSQTIEYASSLKTYLYNRQSKTPLQFPPKILAFADAPKNTSPTPQMALRDEQLANLPGSEKELLSIQSVFGSTNNQFYFGPNSSRARFFQQVEKSYDIMHFALHAKADENNWLQSKLYFRKLGKDGQTLSHDPVLAYELTGLNIQTPLVVLSACQTSRGIEYRGEGTYSLARSFIKSGAQTVLSTLWDINDQTTSTLIAHFYKTLAEEQDVALALREAKLTYINDNDEYLSAPIFWAGMIVRN